MDLLFDWIVSDTLVEKTRQEEPMAYFKGLIKNENPSPLKDYLKYRSCEVYTELEGKPVMIKNMKIPGVLLLYNNYKKMYFAKKSMDVFDDLEKELSGKGNVDIYSDCKDNYSFFSLRIYVVLEDDENDTQSELDSIFEHLVEEHDIYRRGYLKDVSKKRIRDTSIAQRILG